MASRFHITEANDAYHIAEYDTIEEVGAAARHGWLPMKSYDVYMVWERSGGGVDEYVGEIASFTLVGLICAGRLFLEPAQTGIAAND